MKTWTTNPPALAGKVSTPLQRAGQTLTNPYATPLAATLGWVSIGLGLAEILAPRQLAHAIGVGQHPTLLRALGLREMLAGAGTLALRRPSYGLWARTAGDAMDLALLGAAYKSDRQDSRRLGITTALIAGIALLDLVAALRQGSEERH